MKMCTACGAENAADSQFCGSCGQAMAETPPAAPTAPPPPPAPSGSPTMPPPAPAAPGGTGVANPFATVDWRRIVAGNWIGAGITAATALVVAAVVAALVAFLVPDNLDFKSAVGLTALLTESSFGADIVNHAGPVSISLGQYPLLGTFLALAAAALVFRRVTASYPGMAASLGDAVRASLMLAVLLTVFAVVINIVEPDLRGYDSDDDSVNSLASLARKAAGGGLAGYDGKSQTSVAGAIFLGFLLLLTVLVLVSVARRTTLDGVWLKIHEWLAAPVAGLAALAVGLCVLGLFYIVAILVGDDQSRDFTTIVSMFAVLPALGVRVLALGVGAGWGAAEHYKKQDDDATVHLSGFADDHGGLFWISIPLALALAAFAAWVVIRQSIDRRAVLRNVLVYLGLLIVAVPLLVRLANIHLHYERRKEEITFFVGLDGAQTAAFFILASLVIAAVLMALTGSIDVAALRARAGTLQTTPASGPPAAQTMPPPPPAPPGSTMPPPPATPTTPPEDRPTT